MKQRMDDEIRTRERNGKTNAKWMEEGQVCFLTFYTSVL